MHFASESMFREVQYHASPVKHEVPEGDIREPRGRRYPNLTSILKLTVRSLRRRVPAIQGGYIDKRKSWWWSEGKEASNLQWKTNAHVARLFCANLFVASSQNISAEYMYIIISNLLARLLTVLYESSLFSTSALGLCSK